VTGEFAIVQRLLCGAGNGCTIGAVRSIVALVGLVALAGCSSSHPSAPATSSSAGADVTGNVASYVAKVSALCDALLPKILAVTHNGDPSAFTVAQYKAHLAAHTALEHGFDQQFAAVPVPAGAEQAHAAMQAYIAYADKLDAQRLAAANTSQAAFEREIERQNAAYESSQVKQARDAAGFSPSCDAR
jgi:hypothetical protein